MRTLNAIALFSLALLLLLVPVASNATTAAMGPVPGAMPTVVDPRLLSPNPTIGTSEAPGVLSPDTSSVQSQKQHPPNGGNLGGREIVFDTNTQPPFVTANLDASFPGMVQTNGYPYDASIAVGPNHIVVMVNFQWAVFDKATGTRLLVTSFNPFFTSTTRNGGYDPRCYYDPMADRWVLLAADFVSSLSQSWVRVAVSQTPDPTGPYFVYAFDETVNGTQPTNTLSDFPSLGADDNNIYVGSDQFTFAGKFLGGKIRCFSKAQLYAGGAATYVDFGGIDFRNGPLASTVKAARNLSPSPIGHFLATHFDGGTSVSIWTISGVFPALTLSPETQVSVGRYDVPPDVAQQGTSAPIWTFDCRTQDVVWQGGHYYTAFHERAGRSTATEASAIRYLDVTDAGQAARDITFTAGGINYIFPAVSVDPGGNAGIVFNRCSPTEYVSTYITTLPAGGTMQPSRLVTAGVAPALSRWADFNGIGNDPSDPSRLWLHCGWAEPHLQWATTIAGFRPLAAGMAAIALRAGDSGPGSRALPGSAAGRKETSGGLEVVSRVSSPDVEFSFRLAETSRVTLTLFDVRGRVVARLIRDVLAAGVHHTTMDRSRLASGMYLLRLTRESGTEMRKMMVLK